MYRDLQESCPSKESRSRIKSKSAMPAEGIVSYLQEMLCLGKPLHFCTCTGTPVEVMATR